MPIEHHQLPIAGGAVVHVVVTGKRDGDLAIDGPPSMLAARRTAIVDRPWTWLRQVHGGHVVDGDDPASVGAEADGAVGTAVDRAFAVHTADCAPVVLVAPGERLVGVAHAGWRGLVAGIIPAVAAAMVDRGARDLLAFVGPCICPSGYEFGGDELDLVASVCGPQVRATTGSGAAALDLRAGVRSHLSQVGAEVVEVSARCTDDDETDLFSHRARGDVGRQALVVWTA
jgi:YfiH family protein